MYWVRGLGREIIDLELNRSFPLFYSVPVVYFNAGAQWLNGRVLNPRPRGRGFEPHWRHCVVVLEQDTFILA